MATGVGSVAQWFAVVRTYTPDDVPKSTSEPAWKETAWLLVGTAEFEATKAELPSPERATENPICSLNAQLSPVCEQLSCWNVDCRVQVPPVSE